MRNTPRRLVWLGAIGVALVALTGLGLVLLTWDALPLDRDARIHLFAADECIAGALWWSAVLLVRGISLPRRALWIVLVAAVAMRAIVFAAPPLLSSDMYRYVWDGRVQRAGINPYRYVPAAAQLAFLRDADVYSNINRAASARTIYPPAAELLFAAAAFVAPGVLGMKALMTGFDALAILVLLLLLRQAGRDPAEVVGYAWLPLPVWEIAGNGHVDGAAAGLLALALLLAARGRSAATGVALGIAALTKLLPAVVLPAFWRWRDRALPAAFVLTVAALYVPYLTVGSGVLGFLPGYAAEEHIANGGGIFLLELLRRVLPAPSWVVAAYAVLVLAALGWIALRCMARPLPAPGVAVAVQARQAAALGAVLLVAVSPHYPWYFLWLAPLACLASLSSVNWLLAAAPLLVLGPIEHLLIPTAVYGPAAVLALRDLRRAQNWSLA